MGILARLSTPALALLAPLVSAAFAQEDEPAARKRAVTGRASALRSSGRT